MRCLPSPARRKRPDTRLQLSLAARPLPLLSGPNTPPVARRRAATGAGFALLYWYYGLTASLGISLVFFCLLIIIFVIDIKHQLILDRIVYPGMVLALALSCLNPEMGNEIWIRPLNSLAGGAAGLAVMLLIFLILMSRGGMGFGDVKMAALLGLMTGFPSVFIALFLGMIIGGLTAIFLLAFRLSKRGEAIPFGPFLAIGTMLTVIWGGPILNWWLPG